MVRLYFDENRFLLPNFESRVFLKTAENVSKFNSKKRLYCGQHRKAIFSGFFFKFPMKCGEKAFVLRCLDEKNFGRDGKNKFHTKFPKQVFKGIFFGILMFTGQFGELGPF